MSESMRWAGKKGHRLLHREALAGKDEHHAR